MRHPLTPLLALVPLLTPTPGAQTEAADVYYDSFSIPHVFGESDESAMYALGYQQMRDYPIGTLDRLWRFSGRFAEVAGPSYLDDDYELRLWELPAVIEREKAGLDEEFRRLLQAYVDGINQGRGWWRQGSFPPAQSNRLRTIMGTLSDPNNVEMHVDPLPDYLNQGFHPFQYNAPDTGIIHPDYDAARVPQYITLIIDRLFHPNNQITIDHVLSLSIVRRTPFFVAQERRFVPDDSFPLQVERRRRADRPLPEASNSIAWGFSATAAGGKVVTSQDGHTGRDTITQRPYVVQIHGDQYQVVGLSHPGLPYVFIGSNSHVSRAGAGEGTNKGVSSSTWEVTLEDSDPLRFRFGGSVFPGSPKALGRVLVPPTVDEHARVGFDRLSKVTDDLAYFDVAATTDADSSGTIESSEWVIATQLRDRYYAPDQSRLGFANDRYPVTRVNGSRVDGIDVVPTAGDTVEFSQDAWTTSGCTGEYYLRMGRARYIDNAPPGEDQIIDILDEDLGVYNNNLFFADYQSRFYCIYPPKAAIQGANIATRYSPDDYNKIRLGSIKLDGHLPGDRWQGFYTRADKPQIGPVDVTDPEAWIVTNTTLDLVDGRLTEADLANLSPDVIRPETKANWPYVRARDLFMQGSVTAGALDGVSEVAALDVAETRTILMWDFFKRARDIRSVELGANADVDLLVDWVDVYRHLADDGVTCDPANFDFVAHPYSLVLPYTSVLQDFYVRSLELVPGTTELQATFGRDPIHELFTLGTTAFDRPQYDPNIDLMWDALVATAALWRAGTGPGGLLNKDLLVDQWALEPWLSDPRYSDDQAAVDANSMGCGVQAFADEMGGTDVIRWGHINLMAATPHYPQPATSTQLGTNVVLARGTVYPGLRPDLLSTLDPGGAFNAISRLQFPVYQNQIPLALPVSGTARTMFTTGNKIVSFNGPLDGYAEVLYPWSQDLTSQTADGILFFNPHERGSQAIIQAELHDPPVLTARYLTSTASTEITRAFLPHQDRFATSADFAAGVWRDLETDQATVATSAIEHFALTFTPDP